jgi:hypothetical protein
LTVLKLTPFLLISEFLVRSAAVKSRLASDALGIFFIWV